MSGRERVGVEREGERESMQGQSQRKHISHTKEYYTTEISEGRVVANHTARTERRREEEQQQKKSSDTLQLVSVAHKTLLLGVLYKSLNLTRLNERTEETGFSDVYWCHRLLIRLVRSRERRKWLSLKHKSYHYIRSPRKDKGRDGGVRRSQKKVASTAAQAF